MPIIAKASGGNFIPAPPGTHASVCVDIVDLGDLKVSFAGKDKVQHKVRIVWQLAELRNSNTPHQASKRYTLSLHEKAALRKDLESWRGRAFTEKELEGFDLEVLIGIGALLNIIEEKKNGQTYSNIASIMRLPKGMEAPVQRDYIRVAERKTEAMADAEMDQRGPDHDEAYNQFDDESVPF